MTSAEYNWKNRPVTIVGMGRSAVGAAMLLHKHGARPFVTDVATGTRFLPWCTALDKKGIPWELGGHSARAWAAPELVVVSPGVPPTIAPLKTLRARGIEVIGELELASRFTRIPLLAVTGTNGKTTVTELLQHLITGCGYRSRLAGNNHTAFSAAVCDGDEPDYYVLEVSSYQLESVVHFSPWIGAVLNVTPDHLGRHGSMECYALTKARIFGRDDRYAAYAVCNADDRMAGELEAPGGSERIQFSLSKPPLRGGYLDVDELQVDGVSCGSFRSPLPGIHNRSNALAALTMMHAGGFDLKRCLEVLPAFSGVEHRLEALGRSSGRFWYNDSKSTNVDSLRVALESFEVPLTLIAGGQGKGSSYTDLMPLVEAHVTCLIAYGTEGPALAEAFSGGTEVRVVSTMEDAVRMASQVSEPESTVLLSPGCASFDLYPDFEARGTHFKELVYALGQEGTLG